MKRMLAAFRPELTSKWSERNLPLTPDSVTHGSNKIVWWNGKCGHEWRASIKNRVISGSGCPYCSHNAILQSNWNSKNIREIKCINTSYDSCSVLVRLWIQYRNRQELFCKSQYRYSGRR